MYHQKTHVSHGILIDDACRILNQYNTIPRLNGFTDKNKLSNSNTILTLRHKLETLLKHLHNSNVWSRKFFYVFEISLLCYQGCIYLIKYTAKQYVYEILHLKITVFDCNLF